ncbi:hypothetical protein MKW92_012556 [Papaver armeniacum]|nr:hypothetical protein MKW92_012556 [Papaver armeniacum]
MKHIQIKDLTNADWTLLLSIFLDVVTAFAYGTLFKLPGKYGVALAVLELNVPRLLEGFLRWMDVQEDGKVNPSAVEKYEQVKAARAKRKGLIDAGLVSALNFENDEIDEVFGPDKCRTSLLGYTSLISKKQALYASVATAVMAASMNSTNSASRNDNMDETLLQKLTELITNIIFEGVNALHDVDNSGNTNNLSTTI